MNERVNDQLLLCSALTLHNHSVCLYVRPYTHTRRAFTIDTYIPALFFLSVFAERTHRHNDDDEGCVSRQTSKRIDSIKRHKLQTWSIVIVPERMIDWTVWSALWTDDERMSRLTNPIVRSMKNLLIKPVLHLHLSRERYWCMSLTSGWRFENDPVHLAWEGGGTLCSAQSKKTLRRTETIISWHAIRPTWSERETEEKKSFLLHEFQEEYFEEKKNFKIQRIIIIIIIIGIIVLKGEKIKREVFVCCDITVVFDVEWAN